MKSELWAVSKAVCDQIGRPAASATVPPKDTELVTATERLDAYISAYQLAANRYENIYKSVWTIFSYMTAVSAALLTLGSRIFYMQLVSFIATLPLIFWFWTTYLPLDAYGNRSLQDLERLEGILRTEFGVGVQQFTSFSEFRKPRNLLRARTAILIWLIAIHGVSLIAAGWSTIKLCRGHALVRPTPISGSLTGT
jgi:hypothetical protein